MLKIGVIGDYDSISPFAALGMEIMAVENQEEARKAFRRMVSGEYGIIYITEDFMEQLLPEYNKYKDRQTPAVIPIPGGGKVSGFGREYISSYVRQAVGSDLTLGSEE